MVIGVAIGLAWLGVAIHAMGRCQAWMYSLYRGPDNDQYMHDR